MITIVAGTRPEIIKLAPIIRRIHKAGLNSNLILTGQHHDYILSTKIIEDLDLQTPDVQLEIQNSSQVFQISEILAKMQAMLRDSARNLILVQGDTNSVLGASLTGIKCGIPVAHVEAGLRSYDWRMPEEHNRILVDHISEILFAPTIESRDNLLRESVHGTIHVTGNTIIDAVNEHLPIAIKKSEIMTTIRHDWYALCTLHRAENVDDRQTLAGITKGLVESRVPIVFPVHPRTKKRLVEFGLFDRIASCSQIQLIDPQGYLDFLVLMKHCKFILTDSGGIQEEATAPGLRKKAIVLRKSTERQEAVVSGFAELVDPEPKAIVNKISMQTFDDSGLFGQISPFGDGNAAARIVEILEKRPFSQLSVSNAGLAS